MTVQALFVDSKGPYPALLGPENCWSETRDARLYRGPDPVVAHPPCGRWGNLAAVNYARYGGEHNRPGNDGGCFESALASVRKYGGVLEHPKGSKAWLQYGLLVPTTDTPGWGVDWYEDKNGHWFVCTAEVWQSAYDHPCHKKTWLLYAGKRQPHELCWVRDKTLATHQIGGGVNTGPNRSLPRLPDRLAHITPIGFAAELISLAIWSKGE